jgi:RNA polymerase sigma-70 factor, ECF subfamily
VETLLRRYCDGMALTATDRQLLQRCLTKAPGSWNDFVDRYLSLVYHVIHYTSYLRSVPVNPEDVEDIAAEVMLQIVKDDFKVLRKFRQQASLATYITVIARRITIHELNRRQAVRSEIKTGVARLDDLPSDDNEAAMKGMERLEEVEDLLRKLKGTERDVVKLYYLRGLTYEEISTETGMPVNTIGSTLSRARKSLRSQSQSSVETPVLKRR